MDLSQKPVWGLQHFDPSPVISSQGANVPLTSRILTTAERKGGYSAGGAGGAEVERMLGRRERSVLVAGWSFGWSFLSSCRYSQVTYIHIHTYITLHYIT